MVRPNIVRKEFRRFTKLLREAANHLAAPRDAYVKANALKNLARHFKGQLAPGLYAIFAHTCDAPPTMR
jgi:hypothetical protein